MELIKALEGVPSMMAFLMAVLTIIAVLVVLGMLDAEVAKESIIGKIYALIMVCVAFVIIGGIFVSIIGVIVYACLTIGKLV